MKMPRMSTRVLVATVMLAALLAGRAVSGTAEYAVRPDDKLKIKIFQYPELSGEYTVSANGTLTIGPIGEIRVDGSLPEQIAKLISDRTENGLHGHFEQVMAKRKYNPIRIPPIAPQGLLVAAVVASPAATHATNTAMLTRFALMSI